MSAATPQTASAGAKIIRFGKTKRARNSNSIDAVEAMLNRFLAASQSGRLRFVSVVATTHDGHRESETVEVKA